MLTIDLCQQALQHERNVVLLVVTVNNLDGILEGLDGLLNVILSVGIVAEDFAELVQDKAQSPLVVDQLSVLGFVQLLSARIDVHSLRLDRIGDLSVASYGLAVETLLFKQVAKFLK